MTTGTEGSTAPVTAAATTEPAATAAVGNVLGDTKPSSEGKPTDAKPADATAAKPADGADAGAKPADAKPADAEGDKPKADDGAPESYADFTLPEGVTIDDAKATDFKQFAKEQNWTQEQAQKVLDKHVEAMKDAATAPYKLWEETQKSWQAEVKADPEIGGAKYEENLAFASKALDQFGGKELREALSFTGAGNNPAIVRAFVRIGKAMSEGGFVGGKAANTQKTQAEIMYPTMNKAT